MCKVITIATRRVGRKEHYNKQFWTSHKALFEDLWEE